MKRISARDNTWMRKQIAGTNGRHYDDQIGRIDHYPVYNLPIPNAPKPDSLMLEIGTGWGRWLVSGHKKGYIPVGIDVRLSHVHSVYQTMKDHDMNAYMIVTDMSNLPFKLGVFDFVWSFSSIQHVHYDKAMSCLHHINRVLSGDGFTLLEFPNKKGVYNSRGAVQSQEPYRHEPEGLMVRYYTVKEYQEMFFAAFGNMKTRIHSLVGIGVLPEDLKYVSWKNKLQVAASLMATGVAKLVPGTHNIADSLYLEARRKEKISKPDGVSKFLAAHHKGYDNLNIIHLLQCPYTGGELVLEGNYLISRQAGLKFPINDNTPMFTKDVQETL